ncbi:hypothetical protein E2562_038945 [Oryza meyeriana var. granulata]|uniref:Uncharacterized protein n=1 Tax=Oryza meyeriana var. granulata TaxID=110450 RepID=A0A6G1DBE2_9ORYZ|nr:hypothetical protein E2562_038945 [Oryza meyeriana var. granulata]
MPAAGRKEAAGGGRRPGFEGSSPRCQECADEAKAIREPRGGGTVRLDLRKTTKRPVVSRENRVEPRKKRIGGAREFYRGWRRRLGRFDPGWPGACSRQRCTAWVRWISWLPETIDGTDVMGGGCRCIGRCILNQGSGRKAVTSAWWLAKNGESPRQVGPAW